MDLEDLEEQYGEDILDQVDFEAGRVRPNLTLDLGLAPSCGARPTRRLTLRAEFANVTDRLNVINFAGVFSGTALAAPRSASVRMQYRILKFKTSDFRFKIGEHSAGRLWGHFSAQQS